MKRKQKTRSRKHLFHFFPFLRGADVLLAEANLCLSRKQVCASTRSKYLALVEAKKNAFSVFREAHTEANLCLLWRFFFLFREACGNKLVPLVEAKKRILFHAFFLNLQNLGNTGQKSKTCKKQSKSQKTRIGK